VIDVVIDGGPIVFDAALVEPDAGQIDSGFIRGHIV
jgi:hypothetical protein